MAGQKIRIRLKAYDHEVIDTSARKIVDTVTRTGAKVAGPVPLPTEKNVYCVIRSPHKYKDSREHFEMRTHKRLIDIIDPTPKTVDSLMRLDLPAGIDIEIAGHIRDLLRRRITSRAFWAPSWACTRRPMTNSAARRSRCGGQRGW